MKNQYKINLILPFLPKKPGGGSKIMYEYADRLALLGHEVTFFHINETPYLKYRIQSFIRFLYNKFLYPSSKPDWYNFKSKNIKFEYVKKINDKYISDADATISTWWSLAYEVQKLSPQKGKKINFIQDYETWCGYKELVDESFSIPMTHVTTSDFLNNLVFSISGKQPINIYYGFDNEIFKLNNPIETRNKYSLVLMYSEEPRKGSQYALNAIKILKNKIPNLEVTIFSVFDKPAILNESWIKYFQKPNNLNEIYNNNGIFLTSSVNEGWGMPATEAMFCGCAVIATDIEGHLTFVINEQTGLTVPIKDENAIVNAIEKLMIDNELRINLAINGNNFVQQFTWDKAIEKMLHLISNP